MECIDCLGNRLSGGKALPLAISLSLEDQFSGEDVSRTWHGMTMPFQLSVWRENDFQDRQLRLTRWVRLIKRTIPRRTGTQKDLFLYHALMILLSSDPLNQGNRKYC